MMTVTFDIVLDMRLSYKNKHFSHLLAHSTLIQVSFVTTHQSHLLFHTHPHLLLMLLTFYLLFSCDVILQKNNNEAKGENYRKCMKIFAVATN